MDPGQTPGTPLRSGLDYALSGDQCRFPVLVHRRSSNELEGIYELALIDQNVGPDIGDGDTIGCRKWDGFEQLE